MSAADKLLFAVALTFIPACDPEEVVGDPEEEAQFRCAPNCPPATGNTKWMGSLHPISPLDTTWNEYKGITVETLVHNGEPALAFGATEGNLWADFDGPNGTVRRDGNALVGAKFILDVAGEQKFLYINSVAGWNPVDPYWRYGLLWDDDGDGIAHHPEEACEEDEGNNSKKAIVHGGFDIDTETGDVVARKNTVYFSCYRGAVGKAPLTSKGYGFRPSMLGLDRFEAVLRFILADYCGDGKSWTENNTPIYYEDKYGIGEGGGTFTDAVWGMHGALCLGLQLRLYNYADIECPNVAKPPLCASVQPHTLYSTQGIIWSRKP
ncbi:ADYC domain-containing protein [Nannocystis sp. ILAH1]|uniref:ADYC domain-containing protein n=1 Tax=Nannocystis sp. ILAH1 TaxID=2996789 RepID=UPI00226F627F|nr:ADYC domain-containing protein [Nannocystis sp. ILAH1]MCY0990995.1 ADYC domain-containing protein [Nannocystis sp. ILAH1]